jgi:hypothetical protein
MFDGGYRGSRENGQVQAMAQKLGLEASPHEIRSPEDIAPVFDALKAKADEQPTKFVLVINLKTAKALDLSIQHNTYPCSPTR